MILCKFQHIFLSLYTPTETNQNILWAFLTQHSHFLHFYSTHYCTGLSTKDETSETTVRNLYCLFLYIHFCQIITKPLKDNIQGKRLKKSYFQSFRSSFQSHSLLSNAVAFWIIYIIKHFAHLYLDVSYSWPNDWTKLAELFWGNPGVK